MGKVTGNKRIDDVDKLVRKRRGGGGRERLRPSNKWKIILSKLDPEEFMDPNKPGFRVGHYPGQILRFIPRTRNYRDTKIIADLENGGFITCREPQPNDIFQKNIFQKVTFFEKVIFVRKLTSSKKVTF